MNQFIIYGNVPSLKNSKDIVDVPKKRIEVAKGQNLQSTIKSGEFQKLKFFRRSTLIPSKQVRDYVKRTEMLWISYAAKFRKALQGLKKPYRVSFKFLRDSNRKFDYINSAQIVQDLMVTHGWLDDDNADELLPVFEPYEVNQKDSCVVITVLQN